MDTKQHKVANLNVGIITRRDISGTAAFYHLTWNNHYIFKHLELMEHIKIISVYSPNGWSMKGKLISETFPILTNDFVLRENFHNEIFHDLCDIVILSQIDLIVDKGVSRLAAISSILNLCINAEKNVIFLDDFPQELQQEFDKKFTYAGKFLWINEWLELTPALGNNELSNVTVIVSTSGKSPVVDIEAMLLRTLKGERRIRFCSSSAIAMLWDVESHNTAFWSDVPMSTRVVAADKYRYGAHNVPVIIGIPDPIIAWSPTRRVDPNMIKGLEELVALNPNRVVLGINYSDTTQYIIDTINALYAVMGFKPTALFINSISYDYSSYLSNELKYIPITARDKKIRANELFEEFQVPCYWGAAGTKQLIRLLLSLG